MKKQIKFVWFIIFLFISFPSFVFSEPNYDSEIVDGNTLKVIYSVESFNISSSDSKMTFAGYAFIEHIDNYGITGNGVGNLSTYLVAYTGNWKNNYRDLSKCEDSADCYYKRATQTDRNMFLSRCWDQDRCANHDAKLAEYNNGKKFQNNTACMEGNGSDCLYYNVGFDIRISLADLEKKFGSANNDIKFRIVLQAKGSQTRTYSADFGIYKEICRIDGQRCGDQSLNVGNYQMTISDMSTTTYVAPDSRARNSDCPQGGNGEKCSTEGLYFDKDELFSIVKITTDGPADFRSYDGGSVQTFSDNVYWLASVKDEQNFKIIPSNIIDEKLNYYAYGAWLNITGKLTITGLKPRITEYTCSGVGWESNNKVATDNCNTSNKANYNQCDSLIVSASNLIYYPSSSSICPGEKKKFENDTNSYVKLSFNTNILLNQKATFNFGTIPEINNNGKIVAGKGFTLTDTTYSNIVEWVNAKNYTTSEKPYYGYNIVDKVWDGNRCNDENVTVDENKEVYYCVKSGGCNIDDDYKKGALKNAIIEVINFQVQTKLMNTKKVNDIVYKSCDSNDSSGCNQNNLVDVIGEWTQDGDNSADEFSIPNFKLNGKKITNSYKYQLANSYVALKDIISGKCKSGKCKAGEAVYDNYVAGLKETGQTFYVDFKWNYNKKLPFNLAKNINPSLVSGMVWKLNGSCDVLINEGYYKWDNNDDNKGLLYKYRSIDVNNPFPKANSTYSNIAKNWIEWYKNSANRKRIEKSYDFGPFYQITLNKFDSNDKTLISDVNEISTHYISTIGMNVDGTSNFVQDNFNDKLTSSQKSYCGLGYFSEDCDKVW